MDYAYGTAFMVRPKRMNESRDLSMAEPQGSGEAPWLRMFGRDGENKGKSLTEFKTRYFRVKPLCRDL